MVGVVFIDHYLILGLPSGEEGIKFSDKEITKAYRLKALELHPDKRPNDPNAVTNFQNLQASYETLKNAITRKAFHEELIRRLKQQKFIQEYSNRRRMRKVKRTNQMMSNLEQSICVLLCRMIKKHKRMIRRRNEIISDLDETISDLRRRMMSSDLEDREFLSRIISVLEAIKRKLMNDETDVGSMMSSLETIKRRMICDFDETELYRMISDVKEIKRRMMCDVDETELTILISDIESTKRIMKSYLEEIEEREISRMMYDSERGMMSELEERNRRTMSDHEEIEDDIMMYSS